jgi:antitoxin component of MazEF toxin-antitoxin module
MRRVELKVARIGNSRGIRIPAVTLARYEVGDTIIMEERPDGILLRPEVPAAEKLSWSETAKQMSALSENWEEWDSTLNDGLEEIHWESERRRKMAEPAKKYGAKRR